MFVANYNCIVRKANKDDEPLILAFGVQARGVRERHPARVARGPRTGGHQLRPGPSDVHVRRAGVSGAVWYEIGTASRAGYDVELIVHAMKARKGYLRKEGLR